MTIRNDVNRISKRDESQSWLLFWLIAILIATIVGMVITFTFVIIKESRDRQCFNTSLTNTSRIAAADRANQRNLIIIESEVFEHPGPNSRVIIHEALKEFITQSQMLDEAKKDHPLRFTC